MKTINRNKTYRVIDNFLEDGPFEQLQMLLMGKQIPWHYAPEKVFTKDDPRAKEDTIHNFQFFHMFYTNRTIRSNYYDQLNHLIKKINPFFIHKIKANCTPYTNKIKKYDLHTDARIKCNTAVYYINDNDGYTYFENGDKVESVANRIVIFPSHLQHAGTTCSNEKVRIVLNLNYILEKDILYEVSS